MTAEVAISRVVQLLNDLLTQKVEFIRGVEGEVHLLRDELNMKLSLLRGAKKKQVQDDSVRKWISEIREVVLEAEDAIDMFILNAESDVLTEPHEQKFRGRRGHYWPTINMQNLEEMQHLEQRLMQTPEKMQNLKEEENLEKRLMQNRKEMLNLEERLMMQNLEERLMQNLEEMENLEEERLMQNLEEEEMQNLEEERLMQNWEERLSHYGPTVNMQNLEERIGHDAPTKLRMQKPGERRERFLIKPFHQPRLATLGSREDIKSLGLGEQIKSFCARLVDIDMSHENLSIKDQIEWEKLYGKSKIDMTHQNLLIEDLIESEELYGEPKVQTRCQALRKGEYLVGLGDDVKKLLDPIMDERQKGLHVAAVVGMGGIGKSTLASEVYNHPNVVSSRFDFRAWVVFSRKSTPGEVIRQLILETTRSEQEKEDLREEIKKMEGESMRDMYELKEMLRKRLERKTYFIVLDNVWEKEHLDSLITIFGREQDKTSRLLLTTRNDEVLVNNCQNVHKLKVLDREKSWELFLKKGPTGNSNGEFPIELEQKWREMVAKCNGLPLAITVMGGLLVETQSTIKWEEALNELQFHLGTAESGLSSILELSYHNLNPNLKSYFLCFAFFREDVTIPVKRLVHIVEGLGIIPKSRRTAEERAGGYLDKLGRTSEEIARGYLDELINRSLVQVKDLMLDGRVKNCYLHDSLFDICLAEAMEELGLESVMGDHRISSHKPPLHRIVKCDDLGSFPVHHNKHIRSLFVLDADEDFIGNNSSYWKSFERLKIIHLECDYPLQKFPDCFRLLLGLKQLRIHRKRNKIFFNDLFNPSSMPLELPPWLETLKNLELLDLGIQLVEFPYYPFQMYRLRHFYGYCVRGQWNIFKWTNIETLKYIQVEDWKNASRLGLIDGSRVRVLGIIMVRKLSKVSELLEHLHFLVKLYLVWNYLLPLDAPINIPHLTNLTKLKLNGMMRVCPTASMLPPNLTNLTLENSFLDKDPMQELSKLPSLLYLKLKTHSYTGERMQVSNGAFPRLIGLHLRELFELRRFNIEEGGMPQLKLLQVRDCYFLNTENLSNKAYRLQILNTI